MNWLIRNFAAVGALLRAPREVGFPAVPVAAVTLRAVSPAPRATVRAARQLRGARR